MYTTFETSIIQKRLFGYWSFLLATRFLILRAPCTPTLHRIAQPHTDVWGYWDFVPLAQGWGSRTSDRYRGAFRLQDGVEAYTVSTINDFPSLLSL